jgi:putative PIN family toxin of toxin-antitoxin system
MSARIVLDTNVLVSGLLKPFSAPGEIVRLVAAGEIALAFDARILCEYRAVLARPAFPFLPDEIAVLLEQIETAGLLTAAKPFPARLPDPDDEPFLAVALAADARALVTGNLRHFPAHLRLGVRVLSPGSFVEEYRENPGKAVTSP